MVEQRYRVLSRLESGGMAEVFRAEAAGAEGFRKRVAVKRVLPHLAQNSKFMAMFLDEAHLGARLNHANIVSVLDIGKADGTYFIVMEYVDGTNLKTIVEGLAKSGRRMSLKEAIYICVEACRGLSYAHELADEDDQPLGIVHRDISPPNIMLSHRGEVKLADFGLAKAATQLEKTDPGVVKGKFSYLSPEAALGQEVDARSDIFSLGIVLWEMLSGTKLFSGSSDYETVKLVREANIPSLRDVHPDVDPAFETILHRALARRPEDRYHTAREFGDALTGYLFQHQLKVTSYDIASLVKSVVGGSSSGKTPSTVQTIDRLIQEELLRFTSLDGDDGSVVSGSAPLTASSIVSMNPPAHGSSQGVLNVKGRVEDLSEWFRDDREVAQAIQQYSEEHKNATAGWHEGGVEQEMFMDADDATIVAGPSLRMPSSVSALRSLSIQPPAQLLEEKHGKISVRPKAVRLKRTKLRWVTVLVVVLAASAGAIWAAQVVK
jgi:serine/threonine protein kinase